MRTFENYPHDPQRGIDLISAPVLFSEKNNPDKIYWLIS